MYRAVYRARTERTDDNGRDREDTRNCGSSEFLEISRRARVSFMQIHSDRSMTRADDIAIIGRTL